MDIALVNRLNQTTNLGSLKEIARTWIQRSGTRPFDFRLYVDTFGTSRSFTPPPLEGLIHLIDLLLTACNRWRYVKININGYSRSNVDLKNWIDVGTFYFPKLHHLSISADRDVFQLLNRRFNIKPSTTPALQLVDINGGEANPAARPLDVSFDVLAKVSISVFESWEDIFGVVSQCIRVRELDIHVGFLAAQPPFSQTIDVHLPQLSSLRVISWNRFDGLLDGFTFPSLQSLDIRLDWEEYDRDEQGVEITMGAPRWPQSAFHGFVTRSSCSITELFLSDIELDSRELAMIITSVHVSLRRLYVKGFGRDDVPFVDDSVLYLLTWDNKRPANICPLLDRIEFVDCLTFSQGVFARMVMSRIGGIEGVANLDEVHVRCRSEHAVTQMDILTDFSIVKEILPGFRVASGW